MMLAPIAKRQPSGIAPGIYLGISNDDYHADPAIGSTGCKRLIQSPLEYWWNSPLNPDQEQSETTPAMRLGHAYHYKILEPHKFTYEVKKGVKTSTVGNTLGEGDYKRLSAMYDRVQKVPEHAHLFKNGFAEVSVFWRDAETGLMCKCRFDYMRLRWITDLKTCDDSSRRSIYYEFPKLGYDISAAMYMEGSAQIKRMLNSGQCKLPSDAPFAKFLNEYKDIDGEQFVFFFQCKKAPYIARALPMSHDIAVIGHEKYRKALGIYLDNLQRHGTTEEWDLGFPAFEDLTLNDVSDSINYF
jgi:PDDEXK-like domain of unknown function (DUF3799)